MLPHNPYIFDADCETSKEATAIAQSQCAAQLLVGFVDELKALKRFQESLIIVHGDHGDKFVIQDGKLIPQKYRSHRALLLVKPSLVDDTNEMTVSTRRATLLDITPTLRELGVPNTSTEDEGASLLRRDEMADDTTKRYYYLVKGNRMSEYLIKDNRLEYIKDIALKETTADDLTDDADVIPIFEPNAVIEAETGYPSEAVDIKSRIPDTNRRHVSNGAVSYRFRIPHEARYRLRARLAITTRLSSGLMTTRQESGGWELRVRGNGRKARSDYL